MTTCLVCGAECPETDAFCGTCGSGLGPAAPGRCGDCGHRVSLGDRFCMYCGASLPEAGGQWDPAAIRAAAASTGGAAAGGGAALEAPDAPADPADPADPAEPDGGDGEALDLEDTDRGDNPTMAMRAPVRLKVSAGRGVDQTFIVPPEGGVLGRDRDADICLEADFYVDDQHARIGRDKRGVYVEDMGSVNGTFVKVRDRLDLKSGDEVKIGQSVFRVEK